MSVKATYIVSFILPVKTLLIFISEKNIECGHNSNTDLNAAINIKNRVNLTVLRQLLKQNPDTKTYCPKILDRNKVKEVLISCLNTFSNEKEKIYSNDQV